jgi:RNA polymerase sigma-70 factor (ECF subfamily)
MEPFEWASFFHTYRPAALRLARGLSGSEVEAEDLVQEAARSILERAAEGALALESAEHARNYFFRSVHNLAVSSLRRSGRAGRAEGATPLFEARDPGPEELCLREDEGRACERRDRELRAVLASLRETEQEVLRLRYVEGLTFREISERTHTAISTLQARVESALGKIRRKIGKGHAAS